MHVEHGKTPHRIDTEPEPVQPTTPQAAHPAIKRKLFPAAQARTAAVRLRCGPNSVRDLYIQTIIFPYLKQAETISEAYVGARFSGWSQTNR
jgi:hypothetical protein